MIRSLHYDTWERTPSSKYLPLVGPPAGVLLNFFLPRAGGLFLHGRVLLDGWLSEVFFFA